MQRTIDGPDKDLLTFLEVADYLRLKSKTLRRLVDSGEFPRPLEVAPRTPLWEWQDVVYYRLRMSLRPRLRPRKTKKLSVPKGQDLSPKGHRTTPKGHRGDETG